MAADSAAPRGISSRTGETGKEGGSESGRGRFRAPELQRFRDVFSLDLWNSGAFGYHQEVAKASDLLEILHAGIAAVRPSLLFPPLLSRVEGEIASWKSTSRRFLLALGKASVESARSILAQTTCEDYFILSPYENPNETLKVHLGSHPIPDQQSYQSTLQLVEWLQKLPSKGSLLVVLSGGSSALCVLPRPTVALNSKVKINDLLIRSGASIQEINTVRKHLSGVKGGQLLKYLENIKTAVLVISDVIGDDLSAIGSGLFYPDPTTFLDTRNILEQYDLWPQIPKDVRDTIESGIAGIVPETPKPGSSHPVHRIIASNEIARKAAAERARAFGYSVRYFEKPFREDVEKVADAISMEIEKNQPGTALIFGGEITVRLNGEGAGGRNQHLALLMTDRLKGSNALFGAAGTDGIDGNSPATGAWTDGQTLQRGSGVESFEKAVRNCDSYNYFRAVGQNIVTGPTGTNVMDLYVALL
jgi:glycerate 2-kinase